MATRSRRLTVTPGRFSGALLPDRFSFPAFETDVPECQRPAWPRSCRSLFGPMKTTGFPELDINLVKALEVTYGELGEHQRHLLVLSQHRAAVRGRAMLQHILPY